jgi:hypothetical protein
MRGRGGAWAQFVLWLCFLIAGIVSLHRLGSTFPYSAITDPGGPVEPGLAAAVRLVGLAVGYWLAGSTLLYLLARASHIPGALLVARWMTLGPVRRMVDRLAAGALAISLAIPAPVSAATTPGYVPVPAGDALAPNTTTAPAEPPSTATSVEPQQTNVTADPLYLPIAAVVDPGPIVLTGTAAFADAIEVVVRSGDDMWNLAEGRLASLFGRQATDSEIAPYWLRVIGANLDRIRSGDPDLIFPGEVLVLPPIK